MRKWIRFKLEDLRWWFEDYSYFVRELIRRPFSIWAKHRREFLENLDWMLRDKRFPLFWAFWYRYAFWIGYYARGIMMVYGGFACDHFKQICYALADKTLGGDRKKRFLEERKLKAAERKARNQRLREHIRLQNEAIMDLRLQHEGRSNPHFVTTSRRQQ